MAHEFRMYMLQPTGTLLIHIWLYCEANYCSFFILLFYTITSLVNRCLAKQQLCVLWSTRCFHRMCCYLVWQALGYVGNGSETAEIHFVFVFCLTLLVQSVVVFTNEHDDMAANIKNTPLQSKTFPRLQVATKVASADLRTFPSRIKM